MALKYSRQREAIKTFLSTRKDHPTADAVYMQVRKEFPNISLGTVYRNLTLLSELGEVAKIDVGDGVDHFDPNTKAHPHFLCTECGCVQDIEMEDTAASEINQKAAAHFDGEITGSVTYFYGRCAACRQKYEN